MVRWLAFSLLGIGMAMYVGGVQADTWTPLTTATPAACPVTYPNGNESSGFSGPGGYGNEWLWTNLFMWSDGVPGVFAPDDGHITSDGVIQEMKWAWIRHVPGTLTVEGRHLDGPSAPLVAWVPDGYGERGFQVTGLTFPSAGCWEITGRVAGHELTFVTLVIVPASAADRLNGESESTYQCRRSFTPNWTCMLRALRNHEEQ